MGGRSLREERHLIQSNIGWQLAASGLMMLAVTLVHGIGLMAISRVYKLDNERLEEHAFNLKAVGLMCGIALAIFTLHMVEIAMFALFYVWVDALRLFDEALYYSASAYATLGRTADYFPSDWRLIGAIEALIGFLMIGWSTAFVVKNVDKLRS